LKQSLALDAARMCSCLVLITQSDGQGSHYLLSGAFLGRRIWVVITHANDRIRAYRAADPSGRPMPRASEYAVIRLFQKAREIAHDNENFMPWKLPSPVL
jgi:hypothetical protein